MIIKDVVLSKGLTGFYFDDQQAIRLGNYTENGLSYDGEPVTPGFVKIRQAGESVSVQLILEDGQVAFGDCAAVQYSGAGGRDPLSWLIVYSQIEEYVLPPVDGRTISRSGDHTQINGGPTPSLFAMGFPTILDAGQKAGI